MRRASGHCRGANKRWILASSIGAHCLGSCGRLLVVPHFATATLMTDEERVSVSKSKSKGERLSDVEVDKNVG